MVIGIVKRIEQENSLSRHLIMDVLTLWEHEPFSFYKKARSPQRPCRVSGN